LNKVQTYLRIVMLVVAVVVVVVVVLHLLQQQQHLVSAYHCQQEFLLKFKRPLFHPF